MTLAAPHQTQPLRVAVIGGGPAGLMAAEVLSQSDGVSVQVFDAMPSVGRKFLMAGKGGMNITHSEALPQFVARYGTTQNTIGKWLAEFNASHIQAWMQSLGVESFVGTSGRIFPNEMKAAPLLRAWLHRLRTYGVQFHVRHRWLGWANTHDSTSHSNTQTHTLRFANPQGECEVMADAVILALGGGSWARLGSDGAWVSMLQAQNVSVSPLRASNSGFEVAAPWSEYLRSRFAGQPIKPLSARVQLADGTNTDWQRGECVLTEHGIEGGLIYALSSILRSQIEQHGHATLQLDLLPDHSLQRVTDTLLQSRGSRSLANHLQSRLGLKGVKTALMHELLARELFVDAQAHAEALANGIKSLTLTLSATRPLDEAISSAGGVRFASLSESLMLTPIPGVFCAGEMLDWEAPTGGYLLTACFASGRVAAHGALNWLRAPR